MAPSNTPSNAFVTLLTTSSYLPGALVLAHALNDLHPHPRTIEFETVVLVTPETVDVGTIKQLRKVYDRVIGVEVIGSGEEGEEGLGLMGRPDLSTALTKLHIFRLSHRYSHLIYLDADVLPIRPLSHLFTLPNVFSACPDTGWPDCFNSGVMVIQPRESDFEGLMGLMKDAQKKGQVAGSNLGNGSFDGADQGLLNEWFSEEGGGGDWNRLSFTYNVTPSAAYTWLPAYKRYGSKIHAVHFIGTNKPWRSISTRPARAPAPEDPSRPMDYPALVDRWFAVYDRHIRPMSGSVVTPSFSVPETIAAWDQPALSSAQGRMDLEELKTAAEKGVRFYLGGSVKGTNEGVYENLPLEGRFDLMRPKPTKPESPPKLAAPSLATSPPVYAMPLQAPIPVQPSNQRGSPPRSWDAQISAPPSTLGPEMSGGMDHFYENAWDRTGKDDKDEWNPTLGYPTIPESVKRDQWYAGAADVAPDRANVKTVFPWEEKVGRPAPSRVFPRGDTPPPSVSFTSATAPAVNVQHPTPPPQPAPSNASHSSAVKGFAEAMAGFTNAWDAVPSIQRYASRLAGPQRGPSFSRSSSAAQTPTLENPHGINKDGPLASGVGRRTGKRDDVPDTKSEASHDGDDEETDSTDREESPDGLRNPRGPGGGTSGGTSSSSRPTHSKRHSDASSGRGGGSGGNYFTQGGGNGGSAGQRQHPSGMKTSPQSSHSSRSGTDTGRDTPPHRNQRQYNQPPSAGQRMSSNETVTSASSHQLATPTGDDETRLRWPGSGGVTPTTTMKVQQQQQQVPVGRVFNPSTSIDSRRRDTVEVLTRFMRKGPGGNGDSPPAQ